MRVALPAAMVTLVVVAGVVVKSVTGVAEPTHATATVNAAVVLPVRVMVNTELTPFGSSVIASDTAMVSVQSRMVAVAEAEPVTP